MKERNKETILMYFKEEQWVVIFNPSGCYPPSFISSQSNKDLITSYNCKGEFLPALSIFQRPIYDTAAVNQTIMG